MFRLQTITEPRYTFIHEHAGRTNGVPVALTMDNLNTFLARMGENDLLIPVGRAKEVWSGPISKKDR